jgi:hypothetical protein
VTGLIIRGTARNGNGNVLFLEQYARANSSPVGKQKRKTFLSAQKCRLKDAFPLRRIIPDRTIVLFEEQKTVGTRIVSASGLADPPKLGPIDSAPAAARTNFSSDTLLDVA